MQKLQNFLQPLKEKLILTPLQMATIFSNIEYIISVNEELASRLNLVKLVAPRFQIIGDEFIRLVCGPTTWDEVNSLQSLTLI